MKHWRLACVLPLLGASLGCTPALSWQVARARTEAYALQHEVGLQPDGRPEDTLAERLELVLDGKGQALVRIDGKDLGAYPISEGGHLALVGREVPPYEVLLLTSLLPAGGQRSPEVGSTWEVLLPARGPGPEDDNTLFLQDRYQVRVTAVREEAGTTLVDVTVRGDTRLVPTALYRQLQSSVSGAERAELEKFGTFQPNLDGVATYDVTGGRLRSADLSLLLMPRTDVAHGDIVKNPHRRRILATVH